MRFESIKEIKRVNYRDSVYDIELEKNHYFSANKIISHNCRLRSDSEKLYSNLIGGSSSKIGSLGVCTINLPRLSYKFREDKAKFFSELTSYVEDCVKINHAKRSLIKKRINEGFLPLYTLGFMSLKSQYSTIGINGLYEAVQNFNTNITEESGLSLTIEIIDSINNKIDELSVGRDYSINLEQVPAETVAIKLVKKDNLLGIDLGVDLYSNQFVPLTATANLLDRIYLQGVLDSKFSGGSILHINCGERIDNEESHKDMIEHAAKLGVIYFAINYQYNMCSDFHASVGTLDSCPVCSKEIEKYSRVVGFLTPVKSYHKIRREIEYPNRKFYSNGQLIV